MKNNYRVKIKVHPAVKKWMDEKFVHDGSAYDLDSNTEYKELHQLVCLALQRSELNYPSRILKRFKDYIPVYVAINSFEFYNYGFMVGDYYQCLISEFLFSLMKQEFCNHIMNQYFYLKIPKEQTIKTIIDTYDFTEEELKHSCLQKYYYRNFNKKEHNLKDGLI
jgi:hypothetical protein